jgi:gas vesicle protein
VADNYWDDVANEAVDKLAVELAPSLRSAIGDATGDALRRLEEEVSRQSEQIDHAAKRVRQAVVDMVDEINRCAAAALMDGLANHVVPALREEGQNARQLGEQHFQALLRGAQELISAANGFASKAEERLMEAVQNNRSELAQSIQQSFHPVLDELGEKVEQIRQGVQVHAREIEEAGAGIAASLLSSEAKLVAVIVEAKRDLEQSIERKVDARFSHLARGLETNTQAVAESEGRLLSGSARAFSELEKKTVAAEKSLQAALQAAVREVNERNAAHASDFKGAVGKHADALLEQIKGARSDSGRLLVKTESVEKTLVSGVQSAKAEVLERVKAESAAQRAGLVQQFAAQSEGRALIHAETRSSLTAQQQLLRQLRVAAVFIAVMASGTLALVAYHVLR